MQKSWQNWLRALLPRACPGCGQQLGAGAGLCPACRATLAPQVLASSTLIAERRPHLVTLGRYRGPLKRAVRDLKYANAQEAALPLGEALGQAVPEKWRIVAVIPVPLHPRRLRSRGYNQAALLASAIADTLQVPYKPGALQRVRYTGQQAKLNGASRQTNVLGAFAADVSELSEGALLLVDDVLTTGATLRACRDALEAQGRSEIYYAVAAH